MAWMQTVVVATSFREFFTYKEMVASILFVSLAKSEVRGGNVLET